jgi:hypothetical protein
LQSSQDYTTGEPENKTDLNEHSKKFNDRLKVTVGSSFGARGPQQNQEASIDSR